MTADILLTAIVVIPVILITLLRVNAALVFLSLCLGDVFVQFVVGDAQSLLKLLSTSQATAIINAPNKTLKLIVLLIPVVIVMVFMARTVRGHSKLLLNLLPAIGTGLLGALLVVPLLPSGLAHNIIESNLWSNGTRAQDLIVSTSGLVCLLVLCLQRPKAGVSSKHSKHKE